MATEKRVNFRLRFAPHLSSDNGMLFSYLIKHKKAVYSARDRVLKSISAYWLPFAAEWANKDEKELRTLALSSINQLELQIQYIRESFDLPQPQLAYFPREDGNSPESESQSEPEPSAQLESEIDYSAQDSEFLSNF